MPALLFCVYTHVTLQHCLSLCMIMIAVEVCIWFYRRELFNILVCSCCSQSVGRILDPFSLTWPDIPDLSEEFLNYVSRMKLQAFLIEFQLWVLYLVYKCNELFDSYLVLTSSQQQHLKIKTERSVIIFYLYNEISKQHWTLVTFIIRQKTHFL